MAINYTKNKFKQVPPGLFNDIIKGSGIVLKAIDLDTLTYDKKNILCGTSGGITVSSKPNTTDYGEDIDNIDPNTKELLQQDSRTTTVTFSSISATKEMIKRLAGAADIDANNEALIKFRSYIESDDFTELFVAFEKTDGGAVIWHFSNTFSTGGLSFKSEKDGKGTFDCEFTVYKSLADPDDEGVEVYVYNKPQNTEGEVEEQNLAYNKQEDEEDGGLY